MFALYSVIINTNDNKCYIFRRTEVKENELRLFKSHDIEDCVEFCNDYGYNYEIIPQIVFDDNGEWEYEDWL